MPRRRELLVLAVTVALVWVITVCPLVVELVQVVRSPPAQHPGLVVLGIVGDAGERLLWIVGVAAVLLVVRALVRRAQPPSTWKRRQMSHPQFCQDRFAETSGRNAR